MANIFRSFELHKALKDYLAEGLCPIPCEAQGKLPLIRWSEFQNRKPTLKEISCWHQQFRDYNIAIICGAVSSDLAVVDIDDYYFAHIFFKREWPKTRTIKTSRGVHIYFKNKCKSASWRFAFDSNEMSISLQSNGRYVIAPPSIHASGAEYIFVERNNPIMNFEGDLPAFIESRLGQLEKEGQIKIISRETDDSKTSSRDEKKEKREGDLVWQIKQLSIKDVIGRFSEYPKADLIICPFHDDHNPSLSIDTQANLFKCFGCGAAGSSIDYFMRLKNCDSKTAINAIKEAFGLHGVKSDG